MAISYFTGGMECPMVLRNVLTRVQKTYFTSTDLYDNFFVELIQAQIETRGALYLMLCVACIHICIHTNIHIQM